MRSGEIVMRMPSTIRCTCVLAILCAFSAPVLGQDVPWNIYVDDESDSVCDVVNASNVELVVLSDDGPLVIITGPDIMLTQTSVDEDGFVFFEGDEVGFIDFELDGDGFRTLWWLTLAGTVVHVDTFSGEPFDSGLFPDEFVNVPCDACLLWDDPSDCGQQIVDSDFDGVEDPFDFCPDTPIGEPVDAEGCACVEIDEDFDGVSDCDDLCPGTPPIYDVDIDGCSCFELDQDQDGINDCDDECPFTPPFDFVDFAGCGCSQRPGCICADDSDFDGVSDCEDFCPDTPLDEVVGPDGCACGEVDLDRDGVDDCEDDCPNTPQTEAPDAFGCSCSQRTNCNCVADSDDDGVSNCADRCPTTPLGAVVDEDGCTVIIVPPAPPTVIVCGGLNSLTLALTCCGLIGWRFSSRSRRLGNIGNSQVSPATGRVRA